MIFGGHPVNGHKIIVRVGRFQVPGQVDGRDNFIHKVKRAGKEVELVPRCHGIGRGLGQQGQLQNLEVAFDEEDFAQLLIALRLAILLCHARCDPDITALQFECTADSKLLTLTATQDWARKYPQSAHLLRLEEPAWHKTPWAFSFVEI